MVKRKRQRKKKRKPNKPRTGPGYVKFQNPFASLSDCEKSELRTAIATYYEKQFREALQRLEEIATTINSTYLLVELSTSNLFIGISKSGKLSNSWHTPNVSQAGVELFQALIIKNHAKPISEQLSLHEAFEEVYDLLPKVIEAFSMKRIGSSILDKEGKHILLLQEQLRSHTLAIRNWGYYEQALSILRALYSPLDNQFVEAGILPATKIISLFEYLVRKAETGFGEHRSKLRRMWLAKGLEAAVSAYHEDFNMPNGADDGFLSYCREKRYELEEVKYILTLHSLALLQTVQLSTSFEVASMLDCDEHLVAKTLEGLSLNSSKLADANAEHLFLKNPVWTKPFIPMGNDTYFCPMPQLFTGFAFAIIRSLCADNMGIIQAIEERRALFLEDRVSDLLKNAFPDCTIIRNVKWKDGEQVFETDILAVLGSYLIIVEVKSGSVSWPALRGAPDRAKKHIDELLVAPSIQSKRLEEKIAYLRDSSGISDCFLDAIDVDFSLIWGVVRISVTLEDFATIQSNIALLKSTGWFTSEFDPAPTFSVADLETVLSVLPSVPERLYYLIRRYELENSITYYGDELDLLGYYIEDGFCQPLEVEEGSLMLNHMSQPIDAFMVAKDAGCAVSPPARKFTKWWSDVIAQVENSKPLRWTELVVMLCSLSFEAQKGIEKEKNKLERRVLRITGKRMSEDSRILMPDEFRTDAFAVLVMRSASYEQRVARIESLACDAFEKTGAKRCLVLTVDVVKDLYPYQALAVLERQDLSI